MKLAQILYSLVAGQVTVAAVGIAISLAIDTVCGVTAVCHGTHGCYCGYCFVRVRSLDSGCSLDVLVGVYIGLQFNLGNNISGR